MEIGRSKQALFPEIRWISVWFGYLICTKQRIHGVAKLWTYVVGACPASCRSHQYTLLLSTHWPVDCHGLATARNISATDL